jgi:hypothetical protein
MPIWPFRRKVMVAACTSPTQRSGQVLSILSPDEMQSLGGLSAEAIAGGIEGETISVDTFRQNPAFVQLMHQVIRTTGPKDPGLQAAAREQGDGWVYIIDLRTPEGPSGRVPPEDIIGAFEVRNGQIISGSYQASATHRVYTRNGLVCLPPYLRRAFVDQLPKVR